MVGRETLRKAESLRLGFARPAGPPLSGEAFVRFSKTKEAVVGRKPIKKQKA